MVKRHSRAAVGAVATLIQKQLRARARLLRAWRGVLLEQPPTVPVVYVGWTQPWDHGLDGPAGAAVWPVCVDGVPSQAVVQALQRCVRTDARLLLVHCMRAVYRVLGMEEWTAEDVLGAKRLQPWAGVTSQLQTARVARGPGTGTYGHVPWQVLEQVLHLVEDSPGQRNGARPAGNRGAARESASPVYAGDAGQR